MKTVGFFVDISGILSYHSHMIENCKMKKDSQMACALGTIDELIAVISFSKSSSIKWEDYKTLCVVEENLMDISEAIFRRNIYVIADNFVDFLKEGITELENSKICGWVIFNGEIATRLNVARTICRRAEREAIKLNNECPETVSPVSLEYLNKLSTLLFLMAYKYMEK